ncbi:ATP-grasp domain-containing protein [Methanolobus sp. ZRKC3]|uniref:ATP-grasp domain-containing protein n=1 Tax=Methanolobus sp. ZRKC3 TaxID=3125786 RepID=UPI0032536B10
MKNILVIGFSTRNVVCSGKRAGYNMYALDAFCDHDLNECADAAIQFDIEDGFDVKSIKVEEILQLIEEFGVDFDAIIPGSGFETIEIPNCKYPILRNDVATMQKVTDKSIFANVLETMGFPHPLKFSLDGGMGIDYPVMVKPVCGGGGIFNRVIQNRDELDSYLDFLEGGEIPLSKKDMLIQEYLEGIPASVSVISTKDAAHSVAVNEQLIGIPWLTDMPFAFCGNITPFESPYTGRMKELAEELILKIGLIGSNGVDFLVTEKGPVILEVNARFQGSLDTVELASKINIFDAHMKAFEGQISIPDSPVCQYAGRAVLYGNREVEITEEIRGRILKKRSADVPNCGHVSCANEPITSVLATGGTREEVVNELKNSAMFIHESLDVNRPWG